MTRSSSVSIGTSNAGYNKMKNESEDGSLSDQFEEMPKIPRIRPKVNGLHYFDLITVTSRHNTSTAMNHSYFNGLQCGLF